MNSWRLRAMAWAVFGTFITIGLLFAPEASGAQEPVDTSPMEALGGTTISLDDAPTDGASVLILNTGSPGVLRAAPSDASKVAITFRGTDDPAGDVDLECDGSAVRTEATAPDANAPAVPVEVETGSVVELRVVACAGLDAGGSSVVVWSEAGGPALRLTVMLGTADRVVPPPAELPLTDNANGLIVARVVCLPGAVPGTAGFLTRSDSAVAVTLEPASAAEPAAEVCAEGTTPTEIRIDPDVGAGSYSGTIDINGAKAAGEVKVTLHERVGMVWFWALVIAGIVLATVLAWVVRIRLTWSAVQQAIATLRVDVESAQKELLSAYRGVNEKWLVIGRARDGQTRTFDEAVGRAFAHLGARERFMAAPPSSIEIGGEDFKRLKQLATSYEGAAIAGAALARWLTRQGRTVEMPVTRARVKAILEDPAIDGDIDPITTLASEVAAALPTVRAYDDFVRRADTILRSVQTPTDLVLEKYLAARAKLERADLTVATDRAFVETAFDELQTAADSAPPARPAQPVQEALLADLQSYRFVVNRADCTIVEWPSDEAPVEAQTVEDSNFVPDRSPTSWLSQVKGTKLGIEILTIVIGTAVALASAAQTLYAPSPDWGTGGDYLAAFAFAIGTTSGVQVVRHLTAGMLAR